MSEFQFPPSSPVLNAADSDFDPFRPKDSGRGRTEYPTPNPSSTVGRSSSPAREIERERENEGINQITERNDSQRNQINEREKGGAKNWGAPRAAKNGVVGNWGANVGAANKFLGFKTPEARRTARTVSINRDFNILNPDAAVLRVPLTSDRPSVLVGRSSRSCDLHFSTADKSVSRTHVRIEHTPSTITFTCLGHNGMGMIVPRVCHVTCDADHRYVLRETGKPLPAPALSKTIILDYQHTEFHVARGERVEMPRFANILLQVRSHVLLVNPDDCDEEVTDDEQPELAKTGTEALVKASSSTPQVTAAAAPRTPQKRVSAFPVEEERTPSKQAKPSQPVLPPKPVQSKPVQSKPVQSKPVMPPRTIVQPSSQSRVVKQAHPRTTETQQRTVDKPAHSTPAQVQVQTQATVPQFKRAMTPLSCVTNAPQTPPAKRRAVSEEPAKRPKHEHKADYKESRPEHKTAHKAEHKPEPLASDRDKDGKVIIDASCISNISDRAEVENILINHLAFSRLSSTPASFLNTISAAVSQLSLAQLRAVLHHVQCIGVIYRQGKDAAGKPLEEEYYYIPEADTDPERQKLVASIKGHGGLRACRRTHKQYYWKKPAPIKK
ncbi:putative S-adenosylmethionine synthase [Clavispora lusitaniae]|uniref:S-adenosylmethionine synthase n=1 Tax=Clavispora lusitaniae TaxID=36911 RepID=A0AA91Q2U8_CLALS|nr:putative S-adenosylmethionine synthase [Clavispora lusitaniae]